MKINTLNFIDFTKVNILLDGFNKSTGFVTAILDLDGNVLSKSGWRQICTDFHRINPETAKKCKVSDTELANKLSKGEKYHFYKCLNGLVDVAVPIIVKGEHIANLFSGQFFFEEPDKSFFKKQAKEFGFDEKQYIDALDKVPVVSQEKVKVAMDFLLDMTQLISDITLQKLEQAELNKALKESEERFQLLFQKAPLGYQSLDFDGNFIEVNQQWSDTLGYTRQEVVGKWFGDFLTPAYQDGFRERFPIFKSQGFIHSEFEMVHKNGSILFIAFEGKIGYKPSGDFLQTHCILQDITEQKRNEVLIRRKTEEVELNNQRLESLLKISQYQTNSIQELLDFALSEAITLTSSKIGYIYFYNETNKQFILNTWSKDVMQECKVMNPQTIYDLDKTGCWGEAVRQRKPIIINDYQADDSLKKGTPHGHVKLQKFLTIPVFSDNQIVAVAGVANKETDYDNYDVRQLTLLMDSVWKVSERILLIKDLTIAKEKAEESENKLRRILDATPFPIALVDVEDNIIEFWSQSALSLFGHTAPTATEWYQMAYPNPDYRQSVVERWKPFLEKARLNNKTVNTGEYEVTCKDGTVRICELYATFLTDKLIVTFNDISERKQAELKFESYVTNSPTPIFIANRKGDYTFVNPAASNLLGYTKDELLAMNIKNVSHLDEYEKNFQTFSDLLDGKEIHQEISMLCNNGSKVYVILNAIMLNENNIIAFCINITERKQMERALMGSDEMMRNSQSVAHICSYSTNLIVNMIDKSQWVCSPEFYRLFGIDETYPHTISGWADFIHPDHREELVSYHESVVKEKKSFNREYKIIRINDGAVRWVHGTGELEFDEQGNPIRMHGAIQDITERKQVEQELIVLKNELEEKVNEQTKELKQKVKELEEFREITLNREFRIAELRDEIKRLKGEV